jgi:large subunit ribosomal protein L29
MAAADVQDLRAMSDAELRSELEETQRALFNLRFQAATRQLADVSQVRTARRRVARIKTLLHERAIVEAYGEQVEAVAASSDDGDQEE